MFWIRINKFFLNSSFIFGSIFFLALVLRLYNLDRGFNSDEAWLLKRATQQTMSSMFSSLQQGNSVYPPLTPYLFQVWAKVSLEEVWLRMYFVLFGMALCLLLYHFAWMYSKNIYFALMVFFLAAISPMQIWASQFIRSYIDSAFFSVLSCYFFWGILQKEDSFRNKCGYVFSSILSLYCSYFTVVILAAQNVFVGIFYIKRFSFLKKWILLQLMIIVFFSPLFYLLNKQLGIVRANDIAWATRVFQIGGLHVGHHSRSLMGLLGIDPGFLTTFSIVKKYPFGWIMGGVLFAVSMFIGLIIRAFYCFKSVFTRSTDLYFFLLLPFLGILMCNVIGVELFHFQLQTKYFIAQHALFLFVLSAIITLDEKLWIRWGMITGMVILSLVRIPEALQPEFDTKKAALYLKQQSLPQECGLFFRHTNRYIDFGKIKHSLVLFPLLEVNKSGTNFKKLNENAKKELARLKNKCKTIWVHRTYGNDEILGGNALVLEWLIDNGFSLKNTQSFRRIDIMKFSRENSS